MLRRSFTDKEDTSSPPRVSTSRSSSPQLATTGSVLSTAAPLPPLSLFGVEVPPNHHSSSYPKFVDGHHYESMKGKAKEERLESKFTCNICLETASSPIVTPCGHLHCWSCMYQWWQQTRFKVDKCPVCKCRGVTSSTVIPIYLSEDSEDPRTKSPLPPRPRPPSFKSAIPPPPSSSSPLSNSNLSFHASAFPLASGVAMSWSWNAGVLDRGGMGIGGVDGRDIEEDEDGHTRDLASRGILIVFVMFFLTIFFGCFGG